MSIRICISPHGRLLCEAVADAANDATSVTGSLSSTSVSAIRAAFDNSSAEGLLWLAGPSVKESLSADLLFWREWARQFFQTLCQFDEQRLANFAKSVGAKTDEVLVPP